MALLIQKIIFVDYESDEDLQEYTIKDTWNELAYVPTTGAQLKLDDALYWVVDKLYDIDNGEIVIFLQRTEEE